MDNIFKYIFGHKRMILKLIIIIVILIVIIIFSAAQYIITLDDGIFNEKRPGNTPAVVSKHIERSVFNQSTLNGLKTKASKNSGYALDVDLDKITDEIIEELEKEGGKLDVYFSGGNIREYLKKMIKAEFITQYPDLRSASEIGTKVKEGEFQGAIKFIRHKSNGSEIILEYIPFGEQDVVNGNTLYGLINQANGKGGVDSNIIQEARGKVLNYFSIDTQGNLVIANWKETITKNINGAYETSYVPNEEEADYSEIDKQNLNNASEQVNYEYITHSINYKSSISKYSVPFNYLWAFLVCGRDEEFISDFTDIVLESKIEIGIYDNLTEIEQTMINSYNDNEWKSTRVSERTLVNDLLEGNENVSEWSEPEVIRTSHNYEINHERTYSNLIEVNVTNLDIWYMKYSANYTYDMEDKGEDKEITRLEAEQLYSPNDSDAITQGKIQYTEGTWTTISTRTESNNKGTSTKSTTRAGISRPSSEIYFEDNPDGSGAGGSTTPSDKDTRPEGNTTTKDKVIEEQQKIDESIQNQANQRAYISEYHEVQYKYTLNGNPNVIEKNEVKLKEGDEGYPNFCTLYNNSQNARRNITGEESKIETWLFDILQNNANTTNMVDLTKYMLYSATGNDYGVTEFSFSNLYPTSLVKTLYGGTVEEQVWFALLDAGYTKEAAAGVLGNLQAESGFITNNLENKKEEKVGMNDEQYTERVDNGTYTKEEFINDSCGYGLAQWTDSTRKTGLYKFAKEVKGVSISDVSMQIEYLLGEISQTGGANGCAIFQMSKEHGGYTYNSWVTANTPEEAAEAFCKVFERPKSNDATKRKTNARIAYDKYKNATREDILLGNIELIGENKEKMQAMLSEAVRIANDDRYGYSQKKRNDEFYYDCSSLVARLYRQYFGLNVPGTTAGYPNYSSYDMGSPTSVTLQPGDVLWRRKEDKGHVTIYIGNGNYVAAHTDEYPQANQISVYQDSPSNYTNVYRFIGT